MSIPKIRVRKIGSLRRILTDPDTEISIYMAIGYKELKYYRDSDSSSPTYGYWFDRNPIDKNRMVIPKESFEVVI